jgi:hypothetical protein
MDSLQGLQELPNNSETSSKTAESSLEETAERSL